MSIEKTKKKLNVYGCGGTGTNIIASLTLSDEAIGLPLTAYSTIDTSRSNFHEHKIHQGETYILPGLDGSGKDKSIAYKNAVDKIDDILLQMPPGDFNIVVFSGSGGSGSVIGPLIVEELLKRDQLVFVILVVSTESLKESLNSYGTIGTLSNIASKIVKKPILCSFHDNARSSKLDVNARIANEIKALAILSSGFNLELDKKDIGNFCNYNKVTAIGPQLVDLTILTTDSDNTPSEEINWSVISTISLLRNASVPELSVGQLYSSVGYLPISAQHSITSQMANTFYITSNEFMSSRVLEIQERISDLRHEEQRIMEIKSPIFDDGYML